VGGQVRISFAEYSLDTDTRQLLRGAREVHLSPKAFELLRVLAENRPRAVSKQELLEKVWPGVYVSDASLARAVSEIRDAIADHSRSDGFLQTVHGFGYRFTTAGVVDLSPAGERPASGVACWLIGRDLDVRLPDGDHIIGREAGVTVRLDSAKVSRHHARVVVRGRSVSLEDLGSKNGTFVNGVPTSGVTFLKPGDELQVGPIRLQLRVDEEPGNTLTEAWTRE
jgi:DNA-binding winged helix-turn-helix (wHTH) protein